METIEEIVAKLNDALKLEKFDKEQYVSLLRKLKEQFGLKLKFVDLENYNEERMEKARKEKILGIQNQNFEYAAEQRHKELQCKKCIDFKKEFDITLSMIYSEQHYLLYFYIGNAKNDKEVRKIFIELR